MIDDSAPGTSGLGNLNPDREAFLRPAIACAADRSGAEIVQADRQPDMRVDRADVIRRVEADPAEVANERFGPGVARFLFRVLGAVEVAADIAGRDVEVPGGGAEDVSEVLADAVLEGEGARRAGPGVGS